MFLKSCVKSCVKIVKPAILKRIVLLLCVWLSLLSVTKVEGQSINQGSDTVEITYPLWSPDGRYLVVTTVEGVWVYETDSLLREPRPLWVGGAVYFADISPDSRLIVFGIDSGDAVFDLETGAQIAQLSERIFPISTWFGPDSRTIAIHLGPLLRLWDIDEDTYWIEINHVEQYAFNSDWSQLVTIGPGVTGEDVIIWELDTIRKTFEEVMRLSLPSPNSSPRFSPNDRLFAFINWQTSNITVLDTNTWQDIAVQNIPFIPCAGMYGGNLAFDSESNLLALNCDRAKFIVVWDITREEVISWQSDSGGVRFSPDSTLLASNSIDVEIDAYVIDLWDVETQTRRASFLGRLGNFNTDWSLLATIAPDGNVWIWDVALQELRIILPLPVRITN